MTLELHFPGRVSAIATATGAAELNPIPPARAIGKILSVQRPVLDAQGNAVYEPDMRHEGRKRMILEWHPLDEREGLIFDAGRLPTPVRPTGIRGALARARDVWL